MSGAQGNGSPPVVARLLRVTMIVGNAGRTSAFYRDALGFVPGESVADDVTLRLGEQMVTLEGSPGGAPYPVGSRSWDLWFQHVAIIVGDMAAAYARLCQVGCAAISRAGPERLPESSGGVVAFKFRDPDGHPLELLQFPPGRAPAAWRGREGMFLGLDHSAIAVSESRRSVRFYEGLGFAQTSAGVNRGAEQQRMDDAPGAVVEVVGLAPAVSATPHLELLGYIAPGDGRPMPAAAGPGDIIATRLVFGVAGFDGVVRMVEQGGGHVVSAASSQVVARDPDGHLLELVAV